jgi:hypothetical protein
VLIGRCYVLVGQFTLQLHGVAPAAGAAEATAGEDGADGSAQLQQQQQLPPIMARNVADNDWSNDVTPDLLLVKMQMLLVTCCHAADKVAGGLEDDGLQLPGAGADADEALDLLQQQLDALMFVLCEKVEERNEEEEEQPVLLRRRASRMTRREQQQRRRRNVAGAGRVAAAVGAAQLQTISRQVMSLELGQQLQQVGTALIMQLPQPLWCCNPRCSSLAQLSELALVGGKGCVCSGCRTARFCSRECLTACWTNQLHRRVCKRIAAASAVPASRPTATAAAAAFCV